MRNKQGQLAFIINGMVLSNRNKVVMVDSYIGYIQGGEKFEGANMSLRAPITDHYWWITCKAGLDTIMGETSKAYSPDSWLEPIVPPPDLNDEDTDIDKPIVKEDDLVHEL